MLVALPAQAHTCLLSTCTPGHMHSLMQHLFLSFTLKISHFSRQGALRSLHPQNAPQHKLLTDRAITLCFQEQTKTREWRCSNSSLLLVQCFADLIPPNAQCHGHLQFSPSATPSQLPEVYQSIPVAKSCLRVCQRFDSDTSQLCHNPIIHSHGTLLLSERNQIPSAKKEEKKHPPAQP